MNNHKFGTFHNLVTFSIQIYLNSLFIKWSNTFSKNRNNNKHEPSKRYSCVIFFTLQYRFMLNVYTIVYLYNLRYSYTPIKWYHEIMLEVIYLEYAWCRFPRNILFNIVSLKWMVHIWLVLCLQFNIIIQTNLLKFSHYALTLRTAHNIIWYSVIRLS